MIIKLTSVLVQVFKGLNIEASCETEPEQRPLRECGERPKCKDQVIIYSSSH